MKLLFDTVIVIEVFEIFVELDTEGLYELGLFCDFEDCLTLADRV